MSRFRVYFQDKVQESVAYKWVFYGRLSSTNLGHFAH